MIQSHQPRLPVDCQLRRLWLEILFGVVVSLSVVGCNQKKETCEFSRETSRVESPNKAYVARALQPG